MALSPMTSLRESPLLFSSFLLFQSMRLKSQVVQMFVQPDSLQLFDVLEVSSRLQNFDAKIKIKICPKKVIFNKNWSFFSYRCEIWSFVAGVGSYDGHF